MIKIYLNSKDRLVIERNGVRRLVSSLWNFPIIDSNREVIEIPNILKETSFNDIKKENGESYYNFLELESMLFYSFNNKPTDTPFVPTVPVRRFSHREGGLLIDDIGDRNADVLFPVSSFNGVDSKVLCSSDCFNFEVGKFIELTIDLSKVNDTQYFLSSSDTQGIRYNGSTFLIISNGQFASIPFTTANTSDRLRIERESLSTFKMYVNEIFIGDITNSSFGDLEFNTVGARADDLYYFNGSVCDINFNDTVFVPLPHLGYGFNVDGGVLFLTNINADTEYSEKGSTYLLDKGCVRRGDIVIPNKPDGSTISLEEGDVVIESSAFVNNSPLMIDTTGGESDIDILNEEEYAAYKKTDVDSWNDDIRSDEHYDGNPFKWSASELFNVDSFSQTGVSRVSVSGDEIILYNKNYK